MSITRGDVSLCPALACVFALPQAWADPVSTGGLLWVPDSLVIDTGRHYGTVVPERVLLAPDAISAEIGSGRIWSN